MSYDQDWRTVRGRWLPPRLYSWDTNVGWCGVTDSQDEAFGLVTDTLRQATGPATGRVGEVAVTTGTLHSGYEPLGTLGHATRDEHGAIQWHASGDATDRQ